MESGTASRAEGQAGPPALPVKQRRSQFSRGSSVDSDCVQHQNYTCNDVFSEPTDCHAAQCPIHQRYDNFHGHQERFFSDSTPPPVPKKRLARALSLPGIRIPPPSPLFPSSPLSPLQLYSHTQNFDNPLYMLAPIRDTHFLEEREEVKPVERGPVPLPSLSQLSFDTPDEHLPYLFSSFDDQRVVSQGIQHRHLLFLRSAAQSVEGGILLPGEASDRDVSSYQPQDFLLCEGYKPRQIGDALYYSLHSPKFPRRVLSARVPKWANSALSALTTNQPPHVNVQEVIVHFSPDGTLKSESSTSTQDPMLASPPSQADCTAAKPPCGGNTESDESQSDFMNINLPTVLSLLQKGYSVSIERDPPQVTLEDFVQESRSVQSSEPLLYERQVCVVLLQIVMGLQHLYKCTTGVELRPRDIFLVWPRKEKTEGEAVEIEEDVSEIGKMGTFIKTTKTEKSNRLRKEWEKREWKKGVQMLWSAWGSPRVLLTHQPSGLSLPHPPTSIKTQIGALLQYCLHPQESLTSLTQSSTATFHESPYKRGLVDLVSWLQNETSGLQMADMVAVLQVLLWGPRARLFKLNYTYNSSTTTSVHNWLSVKRALLVMKLAERGLIQDQSVLDWEDCLCLQYLSFTDSETVMRAAERLELTLNVG